VRFVQAEISGFDLSGRRLLTGAGPIGWRWLVLALGSRPDDFAIPGLAQRALSLYSASDAERVWAAVSQALDAAASAADPQRLRRLATVVVGGGGAGLGVQVRTNAVIAAATDEGFRLKDGTLVEGGVLVWAGGMKAPELVVGSGLPTGRNGRVEVDRYLRVPDHPEIYVAGDLASVTDPRTRHVLPPPAQVALQEGQTVARNLDAELKGKSPEPFSFRGKGFTVSVGTRRGVADIAGITTGRRLAHLLKDAIEWEYRQSVRHLHGWDPLAA
jgi:NADH:ubiquinone reductase (H+-translocating)